jgi:hypothetical protein
VRFAAGQMGEQLMEAGMQAGQRLSEVAEERGLTTEGLKDAARDVGETFSSALSGEEESSGQGTNRQRSGPASSTQNARPTQNAQSQGAGRPQTTQPGSSKTEGAQSTKTSRPGGTSSSAGPTGGRK